MLYLEAENPGEAIKLIINSPGGYVTSGFAIYDIMNSISSPVSTICAGLAASMGSILLSAGEKGQRLVLPQARVMIHQPSGGAGGPASNIEIQLDELLKTKRVGAEILGKNCGKTAKQIMKDFDRDYWMSAEEAVAYGIADEMIDSM